MVKDGQDAWYVEGWKANIEKLTGVTYEDDEVEKCEEERML